MEIPRCFDFKTLLWWFMVLLQFLGGSFFRSIDGSNLVVMQSSNYVSLVFEFNVVFALLFILNYVFRRYFLVDDTSYKFIPKLNIQIKFQYLIDIICTIVSLIYLIIGVNTILQAYSIVSN